MKLGETKISKKLTCYSLLAVSRVLECEEEQATVLAKPLSFVVSGVDGNGHLWFNTILYKSKFCEENHLDYQFLQTSSSPLKREGKVCSWWRNNSFVFAQWNKTIWPSGQTWGKDQHCPYPGEASFHSDSFILILTLLFLFCSFPSLYSFILLTYLSSSSQSIFWIIGILHFFKHLTFNRIHALHMNVSSKKMVNSLWPAFPPTNPSF